MADTPAAADPFEPRAGRVASVAGRLGCTEGQLYSMVIGLLLLWVVSANGLPGVTWGSADRAAPAAFRPTPAAGEVAAPDLPPAPSAGLTSEIPAPDLSPVTSPPTDFGASPASPSPPTAGGAEPLPSFDEETEDPGPLRVVQGGYASAVAGSPLATFGVPDGSVAVARRAGQPFHITYLQLEGEGPTISLAVDADGTNTLDVLAGLSLCVVPSSGWQVGGGDTSIEDAPDYECSDAIDGQRNDTGDQWTFDTTSLDTSAIGGVAIVPSSTPGTPEFQVVFSLD